MITRIELSWDTVEKLKGSEELWQSVASIILLPTWDKRETYWPGVEMVVDLDLVLPALAEYGIDVIVKPGQSNAFVTGIKDKIQGLTRSLKLLEAKQELASGNCVQIHVPNNSLLAVNEVQVLEDLCTDALQSELNDGWRILAVCPPLSERRPTYILGRFNPEFEDDQVKPVFKTITV